MDDESSKRVTLIKKFLKFGLIFFLIIVPIKVSYHPYKERPIVFCTSAGSLVEFIWIDALGKVIYFDSPSSLMDAIVDFRRYQKNCIEFFEQTNYLNYLPLMD